MHKDSTYCNQNLKNRLLEYSITQNYNGTVDEFTFHLYNEFCDVIEIKLYVNLYKSLKSYSVVFLYFDFLLALLIFLMPLQRQTVTGYRIQCVRYTCHHLANKLNVLSIIAI